MAYTCAVLPARGRHAGGGAGGQVRPGRQQAGPARRACGCSTSAAAGAAWSRHAARELRRAGAGGHPVAQQAEWAQQGDRRRRAVGPGRGAPPRLPRRGRRPISTRSARSASPSTSARPSSPAYFSFLYGKLKPDGRLLNHCITRPDGTDPARPGGFINRYVFPDGELEGPGVPGVADERRRVRDPARGEPARALRPDAARLVRQPRRALGRGGRRGRCGHGPGVAAVHGRLAARFRPQRGRSCTRSSASGSAWRGARGCRCAPTGSGRLPRSPARHPLGSGHPAGAQ